MAGRTIKTNLALRVKGWRAAVKSRKTPAELKPGLRKLIRQAMARLRRRAMALLVVLAFGLAPLARAQTIENDLPGTSPVYTQRSIAWSQLLSTIYTFKAISNQPVAVAVMVFNNNTSFSATGVSGKIFCTPEAGTQALPILTAPAMTNNRWSSALVNSGSGTVSASSAIFFSATVGPCSFIGVFVNGSSPGGGSPQTADIVILQTPNPSAVSSNPNSANPSLINSPVPASQGTAAPTSAAWPFVPVRGAISLTQQQTSAANTAQTLTLTGNTGQQVCAQTVIVFASAAATTAMNANDGGSTVLNFGSPSLGTTPTIFNLGSPGFCGSVGNNISFAIGAGGVGITTTISVVAYRQ